MNTTRADIAISDVRQSARPKPTFAQPTQIGSFAIHNGAYYNGGKEHLRRYCEPKLPCDLSEGFEQRVPKKMDSDGDMGPILRNIRDNNIDISNVDVISFRNNFNKIMGAPWSTNEWEINVQRLGETLFFDIVNERNQDPAASQRNPQQSNSEQNRFTYWGYKFEDFCTREAQDVTSPPVAADLSPVDPNNQYCGMFKLKVNEFRVILAAELDCCAVEVVAVNDRPHENEPPAKQRRVEKEFFVELKTSKIISSDRDDYSFRRYKLLSFWIQSFLVNVPRIVIGFRDANGIVSSIKHIDTLRIPGMASDLWSPWDCLNCTSDVIKVAKQLCKDPKTVYCIKFSRPFAKISIFNTHKKLFLPDDFVKWFAARTVPK